MYTEICTFAVHFEPMPLAFPYRTTAAWAFRETLLTHIRGEAASASLPPGVRSLLA
jgi:hypothetical protein